LEISTSTADRLMSWHLFSRDTYDIIVRGMDKDDISIFFVRISIIIWRGGSFDGLALQLNDIFFRNVEAFKLINLFSFYFLHQNFLSLPVLLEFLVFSLLLLQRLFFTFFLIDYLLLEFVCMLFQELLSLFL
jgi:hypothetical protein